MKDSKYRILLVEDDKLDQMAFVRAVRDQNLPYDCTIAGSAAEASEILDSQHFDIILTDYELGDGTGLDILNRVKDTPVVLVTGAGDEELAVTAWKNGACDYLTKDVHRNYLKTVSITIENAIEYKKAKDQARLLSGAVMSTIDSVYITDLEHNIVFVNKAFCKTYGYQEHEVIGKNCHVLWISETHSQYTRSVFRTSVVSGSQEVAFYHRRKDDSIFPVALSRSIIKDSAGNSMGVVGVVRDISELIEVEDRIKALNQKLRQEARVID
ncbi:MAG: PAS domain-containing protein [Planctomycetota bacterium]|jgi:PAS domain S-box-containing protein